MADDADVRQAIQKLMIATGAFDDVSLKGLPENHGSSSGQATFAVVQGDTTVQTDLWDGGPTTGGYVESTVKITLMVREQDPQIRDEKLEQLRNVLIDTIQGHSLGGLTMPDVSRFLNSKFLAPKSVERRMEVIFRYRYLFGAWNSYDTSDPS